MLERQDPQIIEETMSKYQTLVIVVGQFLGYELKDGYKVKRIQLLTQSGIQSIKLSKEARASLFRITLEAPLSVGTVLSIQAEKKFDEGQLLLKARLIELAAIDQSFDAPLPAAGLFDVLSETKTVRVKVCDRGTCRKRGSQNVYAALCETVNTQGLSERVTVEKTGCLNNCKQGVNVKVGKTLHSNVCPLQAAEVIDRHGAIEVLSN